MTNALQVSQALHRGNGRDLRGQAGRASIRRAANGLPVAAGASLVRPVQVRRPEGLRRSHRCWLHRECPRAGFT